MGIPSYFSYIVKSHRNIIKKYDNRIRIDNLYLDCNSIIYDCVRSIQSAKTERQFETALILAVCKKIEQYIFTVKPTQRVFIAFDGVAPVAKLNQQKNRRYKSWLEKEIHANCLESISSNAANDSSTNVISWNTVAITPGTKFMSALAKKTKSYFSQPKKYHVQQIIVSSSTMPGEGEHKIYDYIRMHKKYHGSSSTAIYGLDADLIMLTLNHLHICQKMYLFRETPHFIKSIDKSLDPNTNYVMDIPELAKSLSADLYELPPTDITDTMQKRIIYDYILLCFFLGNDFMPHFPALNIRTDGISRLISAYKTTLLSKKEYLSDGNNINWKNLRKLVVYLSENENQYIKTEYKKRRKMKPPRAEPDEDKILFALTSIPLKNREVEEYINPFERGWRSRYYQSLFDVSITPKITGDICLNYLEGLEWTMSYYTTGCKDWRWEYKYDYPPLLQDLVQYIPYFETQLITSVNIQPVHEYTQLAYVVPKPYLNLLPKNIMSALLSNHPEWYSINCKMKWAFCKYFWESHAILPHIIIDDLEVEINKHL